MSSSDLSSASAEVNAADLRSGDSSAVESSERDESCSGLGPQTGWLIRADRKGDKWLVAIDLDGTTIDENGQASEVVRAELRRIQQAGHHLLIATGRSSATTLPVLEHIELRPEYLVCSNGAVILQRDAAEPGGYRRLRASGFDASAVLEAVHLHLPNAHIAVEDEQGAYRFTHPFPPATTEAESVQAIVPFDALLNGNSVRVVVVAPGGDITEFRTVVQRMNLAKVAFSLGWTAWLDIAGEGITKAAAAEEVRAVLRFDRGHVLAVGDGFNDIELLEWAGARGRGVAMGHAPEALHAVATEITGSLAEDGLAQVLASL